MLQKSATSVLLSMMSLHIRVNRASLMVCSPTTLPNHEPVAVVVAVMLVRSALIVATVYEVSNAIDVPAIRNVSPTSSGQDAAHVIVATPLDTLIAVIVQG